MKKYLSTENLLLIFILLVASVLRFYNYPNLFVHFDEFSAYFRTGFENFSDLIQKGVVEPDTHPAGVQVFLNYWVALAGPDMMLFKLPFVLMGIASIYLAFKIGKLWFNPTVGLITALFIGFTQYSLTYTLFARPYASGLFFSLMMVWFWSRAFIIIRGRFINNVIGFVIFGALCAYDHYFALFFLVLVWMSGLFVIKRDQLLKYVLAGLAIFILFTPHLNIFFIQLGKGGVESWLAKPTPVFFIDYLKYILHYSIWMYLFVAILFVLSFRGVRNNKIKFRKQFILIFWILTTYLVAYFYSVYRSAVLQYSVLFFTFPFLVMLAFSFYKSLKPWLNLLIVIIFLVVSFFSLKNDRHYFYLMYNSGYEKMLSESERIIQQYGEEHVTVLLNEPEKIQNFYLDKLKIPAEHFNNINEFETTRDFTYFLDTVNTDYLILGGVGFSHPEFIQMAENRFPCMISEKNWFLCDWFLFSKKIPSDFAGAADRLIYNFEKQYHQKQGLMKPVEKPAEYINLVEFGLDSLLSHKNNWFNLKLVIRSEVPVESALLISEIKEGQKNILWSATRFGDFQFTADSTQTMYQTFKLSDINFDPEDATFKVYIWNQEFESFYIKSFRFETRDGNPYLYGLFAQIPQ